MTIDASADIFRQLWPDTSREALEAQFEIFRRMGSQGRLAALAEMCEERVDVVP